MSIVDVPKNRPPLKTLGARVTTASTNTGVNSNTHSNKQSSNSDSNT